MTQPTYIDYQAALDKAKTGGPTAFIKDTLVQIKRIIGTSVDDTDKLRWRFARNHAPQFTFETGDRLDIGVPDHVLEHYPKEMSITLQYGFTDLQIHADSFSVSMDFNGTEHKLTIPYKAITTFRDIKRGNVHFAFTWNKPPHRPLDTPAKPRSPGLDFLGNLGV